MTSQIIKTFFSWRVWVASFFGFILVVVGLFYYAKTAYGIGGFGGPIISIVYCPVQASFAAVIGPPSGGTFMYVPGATNIYAFYQIFRPGAWTVGLEVPGGACQGFSRRGIFDILSPNGILIEVGTSL